MPSAVQEIIRNGARSLKRFSMELGGKSPNIVFADADLERALDAALFQVYSLNGERCTAGSRLLVQVEIYDDFVNRLESRVRAIRVGDPNDPATEVGPLIHPEHWQRVADYMDVAREEGGSVVVRVTDTGSGIAADQLEAIFEPFVQVRTGLTRPSEGTGLGLAISRDLARSMGGELTAGSVVGEGSTFSLTLPCAE